MRTATFGLLLWGIAAPLAVPARAELSCSAYPPARRQIDLSRLDLERSAQAWANRPGKRPRAQAAIANNNWIDDYIFGKMAADGVLPAPLTNDAEFLRRVSIDLTGRIQTPERVAEFLADERPNKRALVIDELMQSGAFNDYWTFYWSNHFEVVSRYYNFIGIPGRNLFHRHLREFVEKDRSFRELATELITASGDSYQNGPVNFIVRGWQDGDPIQDTWDTLTDRITVRFLGIKTECISCHDGRRHLEQINAYLTDRRRQEFIRQSAFFSRMNMLSLGVDAVDARRKMIVTDRSAGAYQTFVNAGNPGPRPLRPGISYEPAFLLTGEEPSSPEWRKELARMLTGNRQFARSAVNYIWEHMFSVGIVDPPDGWDLSRLDPANPPPAPWGIQPTHPELLESLADEFVRSNYSVRRIVKLIAESNAYQLSSRYEGEWRPEFARYFAKHTPRRLMAEEVYDAMVAATLSETPMFVDGFSTPFLYATQLPDVLEPYTDGNVRTFLTNFGRGDWWRLPRTSNSTTLQVLFMMNAGYVVNRTQAVRGPNQNNRVGMLMNSNMSDDEAVQHLFLATLGRNPTEEELASVNKRKVPVRDQWLGDVHWALMNRIEFLFNY